MVPANAVTLFYFLGNMCCISKHFSGVERKMMPNSVVVEAQQNICTLDKDRIVGGIKPCSNLAPGHNNSAFKVVGRNFCEMPYRSLQLGPKNNYDVICYEILVNAVLKIFHHPSISIMSFNERVNRVITRWPILWILQLGRKPTQPQVKLLISKLIKIPAHPLPPIIVSSLLNLLQSLQNLFLDQAEFGLIETICITKKGNILMFFILIFSVLHKKLTTKDLTN